MEMEVLHWRNSGRIQKKLYMGPTYAKINTRITRNRYVYIPNRKEAM